MTEPSSSGSEQKATAYAFSPPSLMATPATHSFFGQPSFLTTETSTSSTNASKYPDTKTTHSRSAQNPRSDTARKTTTPQHPLTPHPSHQKDTPQQDTPQLRKQQNLRERLSQWKNQRHDQQQRIAAATATGAQSNNWTKAQR